MMLAMLAGYAGDVANDAGDVDGRVKNTYISRENAVNYSILVARTENKQNSQNKTTKNPKLNLDP